MHILSGWLRYNISYISYFSFSR